MLFSLTNDSVAFEILWRLAVSTQPSAFSQN